MPRSTTLILAMLCVQSVVHLCAQTSEPTKPLVSVTEVMRVNLATADNPKTVVRLTGVIIATSGNAFRFHLHDGTSTVLVQTPTKEPSVRPGKKVVVEGHVTGLKAANRTHPMIVATKLTFDGEAPLPEARPVTLTTLNAFSNVDQWVSVEATVVSWEYHAPLLRLKLASRDGLSGAVVQLSDRTNLPPRIIGAKLRLTGINSAGPAASDTLLVPGIDQMEIIEPGSDDVFEAPLVSIPEINLRKVEGGRRVRVRGTLAAVIQDFKFVIVSEGHALISSIIDSRGPDAPDTLYGDVSTRPAARPGDIVEIVGSSVETSAVYQNTFGLLAGFARIVGKGEVPVPERMSIEQMLALRQGDRWVTVEGVVGAWSLQAGTKMYYLLNDEQSSMTFPVRSVPENMPKDLWGARMRFTGLATNLYLVSQGCDFMVPSNDFVEVLSPGKTDQFAVREHPLADLASGKAPAAELIKTRGVLTGYNGRVLYVRKDDAGICVSLKSQWVRPPDPAFFAEGAPAPPLKVGDEVEIAGHAVRSTTNMLYAPFDLVNAQVKVTGHQDEVKPLVTDIPSLVAGQHTADLVQVRGRLLTWQHAPINQGYWRTTLLLKAGGQKFTAVHESRTFNAFTTLKADDDVLLTGVVDRATPQSPRQLWLFSPADAKSLGVSSEVITMRLWLWAIGGLAVMALFSGWIVALRKSNRLKTGVAAVLEQKVNERTAELQKAQSDLSKALEHERELGELKSRFVSMVSHEFRTPLGVTMSAIEILRRMDDQLEKDHKQELHADILNSTKHMASLMEQVLLLGRVEAGKLGFNPKRCDLAVILTKLVDESLSATHRKCPVRLDCTDDLTEAMADEALVRQIVNNLITNAVKYSPANTEVLVTARREGTDAVIEISDHGIGIPEKDLPHLYEAFHRASNVGDHPGTGLGLVIVKRCADLHGGRIAVRSIVGTGTTFTVRIPMFESPINDPA